MRDLDGERDAPELFARLAFEPLELEPVGRVRAVDRFDVAPPRAPDEREPLRRVVLLLLDVLVFVLARAIVSLPF